MIIKSKFALLDVTGGYRKLPKTGNPETSEPVEVFIRGTITHRWGHHDGTSREYGLDVKSVEIVEETGMDKDTLEALRGSIEKWDQIAKGETNCRGSANCPLCELFILGVSSRSYCMGCPVSLATGHTHCDGSPYEAFIEAEDIRPKEPYPNTEGWADSPEAKQCAIQMRDFLTNLLPK